MNVLIINASPKRKGGASRFFSRLLKLMLWGCKVTVCDVRGHGDYEKALSLLADADAVVISSPLYVDGIPAHMLPFLMEAERVCIEKQCDFKLYVLSNSGFVEGKQNASHLKMYEAWCDHASIEWGGGLGIGGGVMLHVLYIFYPISVIAQFGQITIDYVQTGSVITGLELLSQCTGLFITPIFFIGPFVCEAIMAYGIRRKKQIKKMYTRPLLPSFLFLVGADIFMLLSAVLHGTLPHKLFRRIEAESSMND